MKYFSQLLFLCLGIGMIIFASQGTKEKSLHTTKKLPKDLRIEHALADNVERTKDPALGYPPIERLTAAIHQTKQLQKQMQLQKNKFVNARFRERGPNNIGGRTRTILIDENDPSRKTIFAGGVTGGLWRTNDITAANPNWQIVDDYLDNLSVGALAQDPNNPQIMFMGTGEGYGSIAVGLGIFRSEDGGNTWALLASTTDGRFRFTRSLLVHPSGEVYAGTSTGLYKSNNSGQTWQRVLGSGDIYDIVYIKANNTIYVSSSNAVFSSIAGDNNTWNDLSRGMNYPSGWARTELAVSASNPNIMYIIGASNNSATDVYKSLDGGRNWQNTGKVAGVPDFTNGQAWYDLDIAVDPFNPQHVIAGGVPIFRSLSGAFNWERFANNMHVDQHLALFDEKQPGVVYFGNDGGVYRSVNGSAPSVEDRNLGYNVTQFYSGAIHPEAGSNYMLGGTQDNSSLQLNDTGIAGARIVNGGDGMLCHIDQNNPQFQLVSSQFGNYVLSVDGGRSFGGGAAVNGSFVNPSDYDNDAAILYAQTFDGGFARWKIPNGQVEIINLNGFTPRVSFVYADPSTANRIYLGTFDGTIYRIDNAHAGRTVNAVELTPLERGAVSSIAVQKNDPNHMIITYSNYGLRNNVLESKDGGITWIGVEGNLPDMPVRAVLFSPESSAQAIIGTELGVWFTEKLDGNQTVWIPPMPGRGIPLVRTDDLQLRESDGIIMAATHGRGIFTSDIFAAPKARLAIEQIAYVNAPILFSGSASTGAEVYAWDFGDGKTGTKENEYHIYNQIGAYKVKLTINDSLSEEATIKILPDKTLPYDRRTAGYSGDFEGFPEDYGVSTINGSAFERGNSRFTGKDGTVSGANAFVVGLNEQFYQPNTHTMLYLPSFDFSATGIYEFGFWAKYFVQNGFDGFTVEYSTNKGQNWNILGVEQPNWYDFTNRNNLEDAAFPNGTPYFSRSKSQFTPFYIDVSFLAGNPSVAFRFVFKSNDIGRYPGLVIDDVTISKFNGLPQTAIVDIAASYSSSEEVTITWRTQPEYYATRFAVERSFNGRDFETIGRIDPTGGVTSRVQSYTRTNKEVRNLLFYRIRSINENKGTNYFYEFTSPTVVVRRNIEDVEVFRAFPNPFQRNIELTFTDVVKENIQMELFDSVGKLVWSSQQTIDGVYLSLNLPELASGVYFLRYKIGERTASVIKLTRV